MEIEVVQSTEEFVIRANKWCEAELAKFSAKSIFVPAGNTPKPIYQNWETTRPSFLERKTLIQVDDVIEGPHKGLFRNFFEAHLPSYSKQIKFIKESDIALEKP